MKQVLWRLFSTQLMQFATADDGQVIAEYAIIMGVLTLPVVAAIMTIPQQFAVTATTQLQNLTTTLVNPSTDGSSQFSSSSFG